MADDKLTTVKPSQNALDQAYERLDLEVRKRQVEAATQLFALVIRGGHLVLDAVDAREKGEQERRSVELAIAQLDAETTAEVRRMAQKLEDAKETTQKLQILAAMVRQPELPPVLAAAIAEAIKICVSNP